MPGEVNHDLVLARFEMQTLEHAVEVVDLAGEVTVHEHRGVVRLDVDPQIAFVAA